MLRKFVATSVVLAIASTAFGQAMTPEVVNAGDNTIGVVDISVAVGTDDFWTASGMLVQTMNGATLRYAIDPNSDTGFALTAPEAKDPGAGRFVSFVSLPKGQDLNGRFRAGGSATIPGLFDLGVGDPMASSTQLNLSWLEVPPDPTNLSGYIARIGLDLPAGLDPINITGEGTQFASVTVASASQDFPSPLTVIEFGIFAVPEPASLALLALGGLMAFRRR